MKIAIIDDCLDDRKKLADLLLPFLHTMDFETDILEFDSGKAFLDAFRPDVFDICFLDIYMKDSHGLDIAKIIFSKDPNVHIIFLTVSNDYMSEGYEVRAWRYIIKPLTEETMKKTLTPLIEAILASNQILKVKVKNKDYSIPFSKIYYVATVGRNVELHFKDSTLSLSSHITFSQISRQLLTDSCFVLCQRGVLANLTHVQRLEGNQITMKNGDHIFISRRKLAEFRSLFLNHALENI